MNDRLNQDRLFFTAVNYQQLLGINIAAADQLAQQNLQYVQQNDQLFQQRLQQMLTDCQQQRVQSPQQWLLMQGLPALQQQLQSLTGPCLLALFHLGPHRDLLPDLAAAGIPFSAPIAGQAYQQFYQHKADAPAAFADNFELLAVDDPRIGRQLLQRVRAGRYLAIYVDGNMGPDGVHCKEGATTVQFGPLTIRVKAGAARLAAQFRLPLLPLFCHSDGDIPVVQAAPLLAAPANDDTAQQQCMQQLYDALWCQLRQRPQQWEYAACLQRWLEQSEAAGTAPQPAPQSAPQPAAETGRYRLPAAQIRLYQQQQQVFLVHSSRGKAIALPDFLQPHLTELTTGFTLPPASRPQLQALLSAGYLEPCDE